ncbi:hypothetical protein [Arsenophonus endosymbiont of Aleurodicus floccissimus]|uniref:hypothetical protein n=1 Tax=Arsenophonus endosymbiont of Aleurodicus floccissimus TaxID=2152761 RepID=UPI0016026967|nr:hypothetical protein [Arsenophonus endosymbiont of Aleurodicus floccissimus]
MMKGSLKRQITGISFNFSHGDDVAVGLIAVKNCFLSYNGHKIFIGGEQDDVFILSGEILGATEYKYFNGNKGNDILIIAQLPCYDSNVSLSSDGIISDNVTLPLAGTFINLEQGSLRFLHQFIYTSFENIELLINSNNKTDIHADLVIFENIIGIKNS